MSAVLIMLTIVCMFDQLVVGTVFSGEGGHGTAAALGSKDDVMVKTFIPLFQALLATKCPRAHPATETDQDKVREELGCCDVKCRRNVQCRRNMKCRSVDRIGTMQARRLDGWGALYFDGSLT